MTAGAAHGWHVIELDAVGSTNHEARRLAYDGALGRTVVVAREQLAGRGRDGRVWQSPPGNLYLSALLRPDLPPARLPQLSFVAALAVADAVDALLPAPLKASLKWPNDVLVDRAKISGILIETAGSAVILGIGINVRHHPAELPYAVTSLHEHGAEGSVGQARDTLLAALSARLDQWTRGGFAPIRTDWLARGHSVGTRLRVRQPPLEGSFAGLDDDGALLLDTAEGRRRIVAGEVTPG